MDERGIVRTSRAGDREAQPGADGRSRIRRCPSPSRRGILPQRTGVGEERTSCGGARRSRLGGGGFSGAGAGAISAGRRAVCARPLRGSGGRLEGARGKRPGLEHARAAPLDLEGRGQDGAAMKALLLLMLLLAGCDVGVGVGIALLSSRSKSHSSVAASAVVPDTTFHVWLADIPDAPTATTQQAAIVSAGGNPDPAVWTELGTGTQTAVFDASTLSGSFNAILIQAGDAQAYHLDAIEILGAGAGA